MEFFKKRTSFRSCRCAGVVRDLLRCSCCLGAADRVPRLQTSHRFHRWRRARAEFPAGSRPGTVRGRCVGGPRDATVQSSARRARCWCDCCQGGEDTAAGPGRARAVHRTIPGCSCGASEVVGAQIGQIWGAGRARRRVAFLMIWPTSRSVSMEARIGSIVAASTTDPGAGLLPASR